MQYKIPITVTRCCLFLLTVAIALAGFSLIALTIAMMMVTMIMMMKGVYTHDAAALVIMNRKTTKPNKLFSCRFQQSDDAPNLLLSRCDTIRQMCVICNKRHTRVLKRTLLF